jgi:lysophospholipase L1-like esterase
MVWRDFSRAERRPRFDLHDPVTSFEAVFRSNLYPWLRRSYLYNLIWAIRGGWDRFQTPATDTNDGARLPGRLQAVREAARGDRREFQLLVDALARIDRLARMQHARALIVLQPSKEEVYPLFNDKPVDLTQALREELDRRGIAYLDLAPVFRAEASNGTPLYFEVDSHPNAMGHALIAQSIAARLEPLGKKSRPQ